MKFSLCTLLFLFVSHPLNAQDASPSSSVPPLPPGPIIQTHAPDFFNWTIAASQSERKKTDSGNGASSKTTVIKTKDRRLRNFVDPKGQAWSTWCIGPNQITLYPNGKDVIFMSGSAPGESMFYTDYSKSDFPDFNWMTRESYGGIKTINGQQCTTFYGSHDSKTSAIHPMNLVAKDGSLISPPADDAPHVIIAYIDAKTQFPIAFWDAGILLLYTYQAPPKEMLTLPTAIQDILDRRAAQTKAATRVLP